MLILTLLNTFYILQLTPKASKVQNEQVSPASVTNVTTSSTVPTVSPEIATGGTHIEYVVQIAVVGLCANYRTLHVSCICNCGSYPALTCLTCMTDWMIDWLTGWLISFKKRTSAMPQWQLQVLKMLAHFPSISWYCFVLFHTADEINDSSSAILCISLPLFSVLLFLIWIIQTCILSRSVTWGATQIISLFRFVMHNPGLQLSVTAQLMWYVM